MPTSKIGCFTLLALIAWANGTWAQEQPSAEVMEQSKNNYVDFCSSCHATNGAGDVGPKISGSAKLEDGAFVMRQIANGSGEMPGFGDVLSQTEILGIANYIRNSWGNDYGYMTEADVSKADP